MAFVESITTLMRHRKNVALAKDLRLKPAHSMGHLHALWHAALEQQEDGDLSSWDDDLIADLSGVEREPSQYVRLLLKHGWLEGQLQGGRRLLIRYWLERANDEGVGPLAGRYLEAKYRTANPARLVGIWEKHGLIWQPRSKGRRQTDDSQSKDGPAFPDSSSPSVKDPPYPPAGGAGVSDQEGGNNNGHGPQAAVCPQCPGSVQMLAEKATDGFAFYRCPTCKLTSASPPAAERRRGILNGLPEDLPRGHRWPIGAVQAYRPFRDRYSGNCGVHKVMGVLTNAVGVLGFEEVSKRIRNRQKTESMPEEWFR